MGWNNTLPGDSQKMRTLASVIRDNQNAVEQGTDVAGSALKYYSTPLFSRDHIGGIIPVNAPGVENGYVLFAKDVVVNSVTKPELFYTDPDDNVLQLTGHPVGVSGTFANNGESVLPGGFFIKWARVTVTAGDNTQTAFTWEGTTGPLQLGLTAFPNNCFSLSATGFKAASGDICTTYVSAVSATGFTINKSGTTSVLIYHVIAIGN